MWPASSNIYRLSDSRDYLSDYALVFNGHSVSVINISVPTEEQEIAVFNMGGRGTTPVLIDAFNYAMSKIPSIHGKKPFIPALLLKDDPRLLEAAKTREECLSFREAQARSSEPDYIFFP